MKRTLTRETIDKVGERVRLCGWVDSRRDHGGITFVDLRDRSGLVQVVFDPKKVEGADRLRPEWVIEVVGKVKARPDNMVNKDLATGEIEIEAKEIAILNKAKTLPFELNDDSVNEQIRMKYRYLDLRSQRMKKNLLLRHKVIRLIREFLYDKDFVEVETPILTKSTPEGARDYVVPSRQHPGEFYALPQSPQQYKQLLMVAGLERYFQIARCFRDEDTRGDRQPEFTQLDIEMSFVTQEDILQLTQDLMNQITGLVDKKVTWQRLTYQEAMDKYNTDKPDLRESKDELAFCWVLDFPFFERTNEGKWTFTHNPFSSPKPEFMDDLLQKKNIENILTSQYDIVLNGYEVGGGSIRNHKAEALEAVFEILGHNKEEIEAQFGHMLEAFRFGAPPHGGIAPGIDRLIMLLASEPTIREVMAFSKTGDGRDLMMDAPTKLNKKQLEELGLEIEE